jgi:hypothetical protein
MSDAPKTRSFQADLREPHWVVLHKDTRPWRFLFRHPTLELATAECLRLAALTPGVRYTVYASGPSHKIDTPSEPQPPETAPAELAPAETAS